MTPTLILHPYLKRAAAARGVQARLEEARGLAAAIDLPVADAIAVPLSLKRPATLLGKGKVEELTPRITADAIGLVIVDTQLSPVQQRNLEKAWGCKVIDRTALILEIFGARARTAEGKLQVELAALEYQKSRLVRSWTHLERQRGGFGFLGGPGESQIEIDRRLIRDRIAKIKRELETVTRTRALHRADRQRVPYPIIALVGYTNAGKSTLFNRITGADVLAMDKLFATLDPTMRAVKLPGGTRVILSDTVGFVSDLPTELVAAFRATLEEVLEADILLHVRDIAHPDTDAQKADVESVLRALLGTEAMPENLVEVLNKVDLLPPSPSGGGWGWGHSRAHGESNAPLPTSPLRGEGYVSALTGEGVTALLQTLEATLNRTRTVRTTLDLPLADGKPLAWLHAHGHVLSETVEGEQVRVTVNLAPEQLGRFEKLFAS